MNEVKKPEINFENEIKFLDFIYTDMLEALHQKPMKMISKQCVFIWIIFGAFLIVLFLELLK